ncbi:MAG: hypothetical protein OSA93_08455 [Akkermansiaceae bacterium]|jgi:hypothetical protein|nr:hypothetical protein [Akkermansiaceae bacterium]
MTKHKLVALIALALGLSASADTKKTGKHLFILSGQSNMTGTVKGAFAARVAERFGKENAAVVIRMKSGRGIRFWVADYRQPTGRGLTEKKMGSNGMEYKPLIETALAAAKDQSFDTVGFIWMQGESDANNRLSEVYEESFLKLVKQLEKDLDRDDLYFVIGRINDYALSRPDNEHWHRVRETQVKLGKTPGNAWIDTDDLNGGDVNKPDGDIHFPREGAVILGQRFADKAIELITKP